jgi:hypothetical protein
VRGEIFPELRRADRWKRDFFHPRFGAMMAEGLRENPRIRAVFADLVSGRQPYRGLRRRLLATLDAPLALAWARFAFESRRRSATPAS